MTQPKTVDEMAMQFAKINAPDMDFIDVVKGFGLSEKAFKAGHASRDAEVDGLKAMITLWEKRNAENVAEIEDLKVNLAKTKRLTERQAMRIKEADDDVIGNLWIDGKCQYCMRNEKIVRDYQKKFGVKG